MGGHFGLLATAADGLGAYHESRAHAEEGAEIFRLAVEALTTSARADAATLLAPVLTWRGAFRRMLGQFDAAEDDLREALARLEAAASVGDDVRATHAAVLLRLGQVACDRGQMEAQGLFERSLALYRELDRRREMGTALWELGRLCYRVGWYSVANGYLRESLALHEAGGDARGKVEVLQALSQTAAATGEFEEALRLARRVNDLLHEFGDEPGRALGQRRLGMILSWIGQPAAARPLLEESLGRYVALGVRGEIGWAHYHLSTTCFMLGDFEAAEMHARQAIVRDGESGSPANLAHDLWMLGIALLASGRNAEAEAALREAVELTGGGDDDEVNWPRSGLAVAVWRRGDLVETRHHLRAGLRSALARQDTLTVLTTLPTVALYLGAHGQAERAVELDALVWRYPTIANNRGAAELWRQPLDRIAAGLPPAVVAAARERGQARDLWATAADLVAELAGEQVEEVVGRARA